MKRSVLGILFVLIATALFTPPVLGLSNEQRALFDSGIYYFDAEDGQQATCTSNFTGGNNTEIAYNFLVSKGLSAEQAAGVVGNLLLESSLDPTVVSSSGYTGIAQWDKNTRWPRLVQWARDNNRDEYELSTQLDYMWKEASDRGDVEGVQAYDDLDMAAWYWGRFYEGAIIGGSSSEQPLTNVQKLDARIAYAEDVYQEFSSNTPEAGGSCEGYAINADGFHFPLVASQSVIKGGVDGHQQTSGQGGSEEWCWDKTVNCHHNYNAADIFAPVGTEVIAAKPGTVVKTTEENNGGGSRVTIKGEDDLVYYYTHMAFNSILVERGETVAAGQTLGVVGDSSQASGTPPHLHFDILPAEYDSRVACSGSACAGYPFIDVQPILANLYGNLPQ